MRRSSRRPAYLSEETRGPSAEAAPQPDMKKILMHELEPPQPLPGWKTAGTQPLDINDRLYVYFMLHMVLIYCTYYLLLGSPPERISSKFRWNLIKKGPNQVANIHLPLYASFRTPKMVLMLVSLQNHTKKGTKSKKTSHP